MKSTDLLGTWSLESFSAKATDGPEVLPLGDAPKGYLTYTAAGYVAAVLTKSGRSKFASGDPFGGAPAEIKGAFEGLEAYAGRYDFDQETATVTHHAEVARFPNWEGSALVRYAKLVDGKLLLSTAETFSLGLKWVSTLTWHRV